MSYNEIGGYIMDNIIKQLYNGELYPAEQFRPMQEEYIKKRKSINSHYEDFIKKLGTPLDKEFINIMDEQLDLLPFEASDMFTDGFRLGARMILDILSDNKGCNRT